MTIFSSISTWYFHRSHITSVILRFFLPLPPILLFFLNQKVRVRDLFSLSYNK